MRYDSHYATTEKNILFTIFLLHTKLIKTISKIPWLHLRFHSKFILENFRTNIHTRCQLFCQLIFHLKYPIEISSDIIWIFVSSELIIPIMYSIYINLNWQVERRTKTIDLSKNKSKWWDSNTRWMTLSLDISTAHQRKWSAWKFWEVFKFLR